MKTRHGRSRPVLPPSPPPPTAQEAEVQNELSVMEAAITKLSGEIDILDERLSPVLRPEPPRVADPGSPALASPVCPIAEVVRQLRHHVYDCTDRVEGILGSLGI